MIRCGAIIIYISVSHHISLNNFTAEISSGYSKVLDCEIFLFLSKSRKKILSIALARPLSPVQTSSSDFVPFSAPARLSRGILKRKNIVIIVLELSVMIHQMTKSQCSRSVIFREVNSQILSSHKPRLAQVCNFIRT